MRGQSPFIVDAAPRDHQPHPATLAAALIPPVHIYKQLRGAYRLSRFSAFWRTMVLLVFIVVILVLFLDVLLVLGALG